MQSTTVFLVLAVFLGGCGGAQFASADDFTLPDAGFSVPEVDATSTPLEGGADMRAEGSSGSVEASTLADAAPDNAKADSAPDSVESDHQEDAWPDDVMVEPWCPESEMFPAFSDTCYMWGANHGWTLPGCCLPDHTCGTAYGTPRSCHK